MAEDPIDFRLRGPVQMVEPIACGSGVDIRSYLARMYGGRNWRKMKGVVLVEDEDGWIGQAEVHWFPAHGVGRVRWRIKRRFYRA